MFRKLFVVCVLGLCALALFGGPAKAAEPEYVIKFSWVDPADPYKSFTSAYANVLKSEVERLTGGRIRIDLYPAGQLGDQRAAVEQIAKGTLEMCNIGSGVLASLYYDKLSVVDMPFLFTSREHAARALDFRNPLIKEMVEECAAETNVRMMNLTPFGLRHMTNSRRPITSPDDMKGLKMRSVEAIPHMKLMEALGASATPIPFVELYTSLQTKVVDGQENPLQNIEGAKFYQVQTYLSLTGHLMGVGSTLINDQLYRKLPEDLRNALVEGERVAQLTYAGIGALFDALGEEALRKQGMQINVPSAAEMERFKSIAVPAVRAWLEDEVGAEFVAEFLAEAEKAKQAIVDEAAIR